MGMTDLNTIAGLKPRKQRQSVRLCLYRLLRIFGFRPASANLIMVDFARRDSRSIVHWLHATKGGDQAERQQLLSHLLEEPLLSEKDILQCLGPDGKPRVHRGSAPIDESQSPC